ncbi:hypothetical protein J6590_039902 [Homalodisca vitripennis]|nr:hypothetical protein J6590_039902 [Homalodisca vitripennis]
MLNRGYSSNPRTRPSCNCMFPITTGISDQSLDSTKAWHCIRRSDSPGSVVPEEVQQWRPYLTSTAPSCLMIVFVHLQTFIRFPRGVMALPLLSYTQPQEPTFKIVIQPSPKFL